MVICPLSESVKSIRSNLYFYKLNANNVPDSDQVIIVKGVKNYELQRRIIQPLLGPALWQAGRRNISNFNNLPTGRDGRIR